MSKTPILLLGATGYIGGALLSRLLAHRSRDTFEITVLVRSPEKAKKLETFGIKAVVGSYDDALLVQDLAEKAHVLFSCANADALDATNAYLAGLKKRHDKTGDVPILIHTSGTGLLTYHSLSKDKEVAQKIYYDDDPDDIEASFPADALHRNVDMAIVEADKEGYLRSYIVLPGLIWGIAKNELTDAGIANKHSIAMPWIIRASLDRGRAGMFGEGLPVWPAVNIEEQTDFYVLLYDTIVASPDSVDHGRNGFYFGENGEVSWYDISKAIAKAFVKLGLSQWDEPTAFTEEDIIKHFGSVETANILGANSRARANHARSLGWQPKLVPKDMLDVDLMVAETEAVIQQQKARSG